MRLHLSHRFWWGAAGLFVYVILLTFLTGSIGFWGDSWWVFSYGYWYRPLNAIYSSIENLKRPVESIYWTSLFEIFGANSTLFHFLSLTLLFLGCVLMGLALHNAFPKQKTFVILSMFFAFFMPPIAELTYILHTDNSRLQMIFFWCAVLMFQYWTAHSKNYFALISAVGLYYLATITYEASTVLIFCVPFFVYPVWKRQVGVQIGGATDSMYAVPTGKTPVGTPYMASVTRRFWLILNSSIVIGFTLFVATRLIVLSGGAVAQRHLIPPPSLLFSYLEHFFRYLAQPFESITPDNIETVLVVAGLMLFVGFLLYKSQNEDDSLPRWYVPLMGTAFFFMGITPYLLAGHGATERVFSSAGYGAAILLACVFTRFRYLKYAAVLLIGLMAIFHMDLRLDWQEADRQRQHIFLSLLAQAPDVESETVFLFLDIQYDVQGVPVVQGVTGLGHQIRMLYDDPTLDGHFLYYRDVENLDEEGRLANVSEIGIIARGRSEPAPLQNLLIFVREGDKLVLLDTLSDEFDEREIGIEWQDGMTQLESNMSRILPEPPDMNERIQKACCNWKN